MAKKSSGLVGLIKGLVIFAVVIFGLAVAVYVGIKATTGVDILKARAQIKAIQTAPAEEDIVPDKYTDGDIVVTLDNMFGAGKGDQIFKADEEGARKFSLESYQGSGLQATIKLSGKQIAGLTNAFLKSVDQNAFALSNSDVEILSMEFGNLQTDGTFDCKVTAKTNFKPTKDEISKNGNIFTKIIRNYIPDTLYVTTNFTMKCVAGDEFQFVKSNEITLNNMKAEDTSEINKIINKFLGDQNLSETINKNITTLLFGDKSQENQAGLLTCIANSNVNVELDGTEVKIVINKE